MLISFNIFFGPFLNDLTIPFQVDDLHEYISNIFRLVICVFRHCNICRVGFLTYFSFII